MIAERNSGHFLPGSRRVPQASQTRAPLFGLVALHTPRQAYTRCSPTWPVWAPRLSPRPAGWWSRSTPVRAACPRGYWADVLAPAAHVSGSSLPVKSFDLCRVEDSHIAILAAAKQPPVFAAATVLTPSALPPVLVDAAAAALLAPAAYPPMRTGCHAERAANELTDAA